MNRKAIFAALFIAIMAMSATYASPGAAMNNSSFAPQRNEAPFSLALPPSMNYTIEGTLIAYINASGYLLASTNWASFPKLNITLRQLYLAVKITLRCDKIVVNATTGQGTANVNVTADLVGRVNAYFGTATGNQSIIDSVNKHYSQNWLASFFIPYGESNKNFTTPFPSFVSDPTNIGSNAPDPLQIRLTNKNVTSEGIDYSTVRHIRLDFSTWMEKKVNSTLNGLWSKVAESAAALNIPGLQGGFTVPTSIGRVDIWKGNGTASDGVTKVPDILLAASELINLVVKFSLVGQGAFNFNVGQNSFSANYNVNFHATFGLYYALTVTTDYFRTHNFIGNNEINTYEITVPENATLVKRNVTVIVYFASPAHGIDVTAGEQRGNTTFGGHTLFFVDYGLDGAPDFATDGSTMYQLRDATGTVSGTGTTRTVTVNKGSDPWVYFKLDVTGYGIKDVKRNDGVTLNATQYWTNNGVLYVSDDPAYTYTVELIGAPSGGLSPTLLVGIGVVALIAVVALVMLVRRRSGSSGVSVKVV